MKPYLRTAVLLILTLYVFTGCAYTSIRRPLDQDYDRTELGSKEGQSHTYTFLWLFAWGDAGSKAAAENGGIKVIRHADMEVYSVFLGLYTRMTTVVYGD